MALLMYLFADLFTNSYGTALLVYFAAEKTLSEILRFGVAEVIVDARLIRGQLGAPPDRRCTSAYKGLEKDGGGHYHCCLNLWALGAV